MEWFPISVLFGAIGTLCMTIAFLFNLLYKNVSGDRDHYRDQLMPGFKALLDALTNLNQDVKTQAEAMSSMKDDMRRIREELFYKHDPGGRR